ncbi:sulfite exporter TauE/SafE family protein [Halococcus salsus]|uniref:sulfite exporter TauE/SafE family protein n=1 Tax=Halococcus salsus TaxID=2162894 RepID=UPI0013595CB0|nr:sulfite exporter TauE/SafE family protein [Halococcus salsus]
MVVSFALPFGLGLAALLIGIAFVSGIGITAIGPGGIFLTVALYALTSVDSAVIAGTVQVAFLATGLLGALAYIRSGELSRENLLLTGLLCIGSIGGALLGAWLNGFVSRELFGLLLGCLTGLTGVTIVYREYRDLGAISALTPETTRGKVGYLFLGVVLGTFSGLLGVGGPVIAVPALVILGVPMLFAVAVAQVQSVFIALFAAVGYLSQGAISPSLAVLVGAPLLAGVLLGWKIAHRIEPSRLKIVLGGILIVVTPYLAF